MFTGFLFHGDSVWETQNGGSSYNQMLILFLKTAHQSNIYPLLEHVLYVCVYIFSTSVIICLVWLNRMQSFISCLNGAAVKKIDFQYGTWWGFLDFTLRTLIVKYL